jgi:peptidoglycan-associated lipoprotein
MKKAFAGLLLFLAFSHSFSQTFTLNDTAFTAGSIYRTYRLYFDLSKCSLLPECKLHIDSIADFIKKFPQLNFEIGVHSDSRGSDAANQKLTLCRAREIKFYLVHTGIDEKRLTIAGYGEEKLLVPDTKIQNLKTKEEQEHAHSLNRRVEFKIISL